MVEKGCPCSNRLAEGPLLDSTLRMVSVGRKKGRNPTVKDREKGRWGRRSLVDDGFVENGRIRLEMREGDEEGGRKRWSGREADKKKGNEAGEVNTIVVGGDMEYLATLKKGVTVGILRARGVRYFAQGANVKAGLRNAEQQHEPSIHSIP